MYVLLINRLDNNKIVLVNNYAIIEREYNNIMLHQCVYYYYNSVMRIRTAVN